MPVEAAPIVVQPSGEFLGNDGSWSTFPISVGVPPQTVQVLPSTETQENLLVLPAGCSAKGDPANCTQTRGGVYNYTFSSKWVSKNIYTLNLEGNLGLDNNYDNGQFGYDQVSLPTAHQGNVTLAEQIIAGIATKDFFLGTLGLSQAPVNFTDPFDSRPSLITNLHNQSLIPSLSYGFTAGASYRNNATASLTLGGYDAARFTPNDVSFNLAADPVRQLVVALETVSFSDSSTAYTPLLTDGILALVDSTVPAIWLPLSACTAFENAFGISYNPFQNLYLVNDTVHEKMVKQNASVTFTLAQTIGSKESVNITLPYSTFDLEIGYPLVSTKQRYFPLRRAADNTQYTLGRTFLQESYLTVDYGNKNFSISQTSFTDQPADIIAIAASNGTTGSTSSTGSGGGSTITKTTSHSSHSFPVGAIAGIIVAVILIAFVSGYFTARQYRRRRSGRKSMPDGVEELAAYPRYPHGKAEVDGAQSSGNLPVKKGPQVDEYSVPASPSPYHGSELQGASSSYMAYPTELPGSPPPHRSEAPSPEPFYRSAEMPGTEPSVNELWATREGITPEMPSPELRSTGSSPIRGGSPSPDLPSALSSPGPIWGRPHMHSRRPASDRLSTSSTDRPLHDRKNSDETVSSYAPTNPSHLHLRQDSNDSESLITLNRNPSQSTDSNPVANSVARGLSQRQGFHRTSSYEAESIGRRLEEPTSSSTPLVGRRPSNRRRESGHLSAAAGKQLGSMTEEGLVEEPKEEPMMPPPPQ